MQRAARRAMRVRRTIGVRGVASETQVDEAIRAAGLGLREDRPYRGRILGRYYRETVCVRAGLDPAYRLIVKAHELGHALAGDDAAAGVFYTQSPDAPAAAEEAAHIFAWTLLLGAPARTRPALTRQLRRAYAAGIPLSWACLVVSILSPGLPPA